MGLYRYTAEFKLPNKVRTETIGRKVWGTKMLPNPFRLITKSSGQRDSTSIFSAKLTYALLYHLSYSEIKNEIDQEGPMMIKINSKGPHTAL